MITICLQGNLISVEPTLLLNQFLIKQGYVENNFAVAINQKFIPRTRYAGLTLQEGDVIDIIMPMQGG